MIADIKLELRLAVEMRTFTDSKQLFHAMISGRRTTKRRPTVEIASARQAYCVFVINHVGMVTRAENPSERLVKLTDNGALARILNTHRNLLRVTDWIERMVKSSNDWKIQQCECSRYTCVLQSLL